MKLIEASRALVRRRPSPKAAMLMPAAIPFQSDLGAIMEQLPPVGMRLTMHLVATLVVVLIVIASLVKIDVIVSGSGQLVTDQPTDVIQPMDRALVRELNVKAGDTVTKGEVLATLDPTFTQADMASLSAHQHSLMAQIRRIEAELNGTTFVASSDADPDEALQAKLFQERQEQLASRLRTFDEDIEHDQASLKTTEDARSSLEKQVSVAKDLEKMRSDLLATQSGSRLNYLDSLSARLRAERDYQDAVNHLTELHHSLSSKEAERRTFVDDWRRQLLEDLVKARTDAANNDEGLAKAVRMHDLVVLTAREDGIVLDVANRSVGSVLQGGEPFITIVPAGVPLIANVAITSADVGYTTPGNKVEVKVDAFPFQRHGMLKGTLRSIGEESFTQQAAQAATSQVAQNQTGSFHRGQIELTDSTLRNLPAGARLIPGMTVSAEIEVGSRSIISYFLYPLIRGLRESMHEP
jgi:HlyD family secretion protein